MSRAVMAKSAQKNPENIAFLGNSKPGTAIS
jgi:hypothetical protein